MQFTDPGYDASWVRARSVARLIEQATGQPATSAFSSGAPTLLMVSLPGATAVFDAVAGRITFLDVDGERRTLQLPGGVTSEVVATLTMALSGPAKTWETIAWGADT